MKYKTPNMELVNLDMVDIITASPFGEGEIGTYDNDNALITPPDWGN